MNHHIAMVVALAGGRCSCRCDGSSLVGVHVWITMTMNSLLWDTSISFLLVLIRKFLRLSFGFKSLVTCTAVCMSVAMLCVSEGCKERRNKWCTSIIRCCVESREYSLWRAIYHELLFFSPVQLSRRWLSQSQQSAAARPLRCCRWHS